MTSLTGLTNWAGNVRFAARSFHRPTTVAELQALVAGSDRVRALGTGHSFSALADTTGDLVSLAGLAPLVHVEGRQVTVAAGVRFGELTQTLHAAGLALHNLGSLPHISVAGAVATGTHGSGDGRGNLASAVSAVEMVTATGDLVTIRHGEPDFAGSVVALGALGIVTALTFDLVPAFALRQWVLEDVPLDDLPGVLAAAYSVSAVTWWDEPRFDQVWLKSRADAPPPGLLGGRLADGPRHMIRGVPADHTTQQGGVIGPWHERLPHFRLDHTPSSGHELQSEYLVDRSDGPAAVAALAAIRARIAAVLQVAEVRSIAADDLWLSPAYGRDSVALHVTWLSDGDAVAPAVAAVEEALAPFEPRPHWGKVFGLSPTTVRARYPRFTDAVVLRTRFDPTEKFTNAMLNAY